MEQTSKLKAYVIVGLLSLAVVFGIGLFWFLFLAPNLGAGAELGVMGWFLFSFAAGLTMIVLPCTLPLAFVIVPLSMGRGMVKGLGMALSFGAGVALMLSVYGIVAAALGKAGINFLGAGGEDFKNWIYFFAGIFAYVFALGEIGLLKLRMPSYAGSAPDFIQQRKDYAKAFLLGLFLGNVGIGCPHPATPLILIEIASSGDIFYGWALFFVHAIGRVVPLLFLALLGILGVNGLSWLVARKDKIERATGWAMVFVGGFILTLGLFSHDWWVNSGQHNMLEKITQEDWFTARINTQLETAVPHSHGVAMGTGIFGQPLEWGNWFVVLLWIIPFWWYYRREKKRVLGTPALQIQKLGERMRRIEEERRGLEVTLHIPESAEGARVKVLEEQMDGLVKERMVLEEAMRYGAESGMRDPVSQKYEEDALYLRRNWYLTITVLLIAVFYFFLPFWFMNFKGLEGERADESPHAAMTVTKVSDAIKAIDAGTKATMQVIDESQPHGH